MTDICLDHKLKKRTIISTVLFAVFCAFCVSVARLKGSIISLAGFNFAYTDLFVIVSAGIGGVGCGLLSFSILFIVEMLRLSGDFVSLYSLSTYLILALLSAHFAYLGFFKGWKKLISLIVLFSIILSVLWFLTFTLILLQPNEKNVFYGGSFFRLFIDALPESILSVVIVALYFRFAPDSVKLYVGSGWRYVDSCECNDKFNVYKFDLSKRIIVYSMAEAVLLCLAAIVFSDIQMSINEGWGISIHYIFVMWKANLQLALLLMNAAVPIAYIFNLKIEKHIVNPINDMSYVMEQYFSQEDSRLSTLPELDIHSGDEIENLYNSLRKMVSDMSGYLDMWEKQTKLESDLKLAASANKAKSDFLSSMSHEIRTPINAVLGLDEMILREADDEVILGYASDIQSSGKMLLSIINDILDFSKIEAGKMEIIPVDYNLSSLISDLVNMISGRAEKKDLSFEVLISKEIPYLLRGDDTRLKQCILNILTNAVKYTRVGSVTFKMSANKKDDNHIMLFVSVTDTGIGIKEEDLQKLYSPFERIEERRNRGIEGTGLGMSIVQNLLAAMGSHLDVQSEYGKGSTFSFSVEQEVRSWDKIEDWKLTKERSSSNSSHYKESFQAPAAHILVVDDTPMNLTVIRGLLKNTRIQIDLADSAIEALDMARNTSYHLIFADHLMPKMSGIQMLHELRSDSKSVNQNTICIILTANAVSGAREMYLNEGFADYLSKPIESEKLEELLVKYLPSDLVLYSGDDGFIEKNADWDGIERRSHSCGAAGELFVDLFGLDIEEALKNCGSKDVFLDAVKSFAETIEEKANAIENYASLGDCKNYTILVHSLKSTSRLIGADDLSQKAKLLEEAGNREDIDKIKEDTPELLKLYRSYLPKLMHLCGKLNEESLLENDDKPLITTKELEEALKALKEVVSTFDFDTASNIIEELNNYTMIPDFKSQYKEICKALRSMDADRVLKLL